MTYETKYFGHDKGGKDFKFATHSTWEAFQKTLKDKRVPGQTYYLEKMRNTERNFHEVIS